MARSDVVREYGGVSADDRRAERRRRLLAAGRQIWGASGLRDVTVRGVCSAAGLQPRYFYEHFADRGALVGAVADEVRTELFTKLVESSVEVDGGIDGGLEERLRAALAAFFGIIAADPRIHRIMSTDLAGVPGLPAGVHAVAADWFTLRDLTAERDARERWSTGHSAEGRPERLVRGPSALRPGAPAGAATRSRTNMLNSITWPDLLRMNVFARAAAIFPRTPHWRRIEVMTRGLSLEAPSLRLPNWYSTSLTVQSFGTNFKRSNRTL